MYTKSFIQKLHLYNWCSFWIKELLFKINNKKKISQEQATSIGVIWDMIIKKILFSQKCSLLILKCYLIFCKKFLLHKLQPFSLFINESKNSDAQKSNLYYFKIQKKRANIWLDEWCAKSKNMRWIKCVQWKSKSTTWKMIARDTTNTWANDKINET